MLKTHCQTTFVLACCLVVCACSSDTGTQSGEDTGPSSDIGQMDVGADGSSDAGDSGKGETGTTMDVGSDTSAADTEGPADTSTPDVADVGDGGAGADATDADDGAGDAGPSVYQGSGPVYEKGNLNVDKVEISSDSTDSPVDAIVFAPQAAGTYAVVAFQHGFSLRNKYYDTILSRLASHGFVVVAPQMYEPSPVSAPSSKEEAKSARKFYGWLEDNLASSVSVTPSFEHFGLAGHSRGAKVTWMVLENGYGGASAVASVDPVDGSGGPGGGGTMVTDGGLMASLPSLILGTGLGPETKFGMACAPEGRNHVQFYEGAKSPSYHVVATKYGHMDMLDDQNSCGLTCSACVEGPDDDKMRTVTAGMLTALFRATLQGTSGDRGTLTDESATPMTIETDSK